MTKRKSKRQTRPRVAAPQEKRGTNWTIVTAVGVVVLFMFMLLFVLLNANPDDQGLSIAEINETAVANATDEALGVEEAAGGAQERLDAYCTDNAERCIISGNPNAAVTVYELSDYGCPVCKRFNEENLPQLREAYIDSEQIAFIKLPAAILTNQGGGVQTPRSPEAALCANEQEFGAEYHVALFGIQTPHRDPADRALIDLADAVGLDVAQFESCYNSGRYQDAAQANTRLARELGINATPSFFVNGEVVSGLQFEQLIGLIEANLAQ